MSDIDVDHLVRRISSVENFDISIEVYRTPESYQVLRIVAMSQTDRNLEWLPIKEHDYGQFLFIKGTISGPLFANLLKGRSTLADSMGLIDASVSCGFLPITRSFYHQHVYTEQQYSFHRREYPYDLYTLQVDIDNLPEFSRYIQLNSGDLPVLTLQEAEVYYLFDHVLEFATPSRQALEILIEDRRAKFETISLKDAKLQIQASGTDVDFCNVKVVGKGPGVIKVVSAKEAVSNGINLGVNPRDLQVYLTLNDDVMDGRFFNNFHPILTDSIGLVEREGDTSVSTESTDLSRVFVIHGRNADMRKSMFDFLRSIRLRPIEWLEAIQMTNTPSPFVGQILDAAFTNAQAIIALLSPDDEVRLLSRFHASNEDAIETEIKHQARPNVLFETGMAFGRNPERTIIVQVGDLKPFSDIAGRHTVRLDNSAEKRLELIRRLELAGCKPDIQGVDWMTTGNFAVD